MGKKKMEMGRQEQAEAEQGRKQSVAKAAADSGPVYMYYIRSPVYNPAFPRRGYTIPKKKKLCIIRRY